MLYVSPAPPQDRSSLVVATHGGWTVSVRRDRTLWLTADGELPLRVKLEEAIQIPLLRQCLSHPIVGSMLRRSDSEERQAMAKSVDDWPTLCLRYDWVQSVLRHELCSESEAWTLARIKYP